MTPLDRKEAIAADKAAAALEKAATALSIWMANACIWQQDYDHSAVKLRMDMREYAGFLEQKYQIVRKAP